MEVLHSLFLLACLFSAKTDAAECENGWTPYKDETCIIASTDVFSFDDANLFCASKSNSLAHATMVMVKESGVQEFLIQFTKDFYDNVWLGSKYDSNSAQFKWQDGDPLTFTNWADGYPRNNTGSDACIQLRPINAKANYLEGKWEDISCQRRNLAICQRALTWSLEDATREILNLRKELQATTDDLQLTKQDLDATKANLETVNGRVVPVGSIYVEYYGQPSPPTLWPAYGWRDVSSSYAGLFFRAMGGNSESWGVKQNQCTPRISRVNFAHGSGQPAWGRDFPKNGSTGDVWVGKFTKSTANEYEGLSFIVEGCEVRPQNQGIRMWKRTS